MARPEAERLVAAFKSAYVEAELTQEQIAEELGVHQTTVSGWVAGKAQPPLHHLPKIDEMCGQPKGYILRLAGYVDDVLDTVSVIEADTSITPDDRAALVRYYGYMRRDAAAQA